MAPFPDGLFMAYKWELLTTYILTGMILQGSFRHTLFLEESFFCTTLHGDLLVKVVCSRRSQDIYDRVQKTSLFAHIFQNVFL